MEETVTGTERSCRRRSQNKANGAPTEGGATNAIRTLSPHRSRRVGGSHASTQKGGGVVYCGRRVSLKKVPPQCEHQKLWGGGFGGGGEG